MVGETLCQYIQRLKVEKAATQLVSCTRKPITDIALDCGFSTPSVFARAFKESFSMSASAYRFFSQLAKEELAHRDNIDFQRRLVRGAEPALAHENELLPSIRAVIAEAKGLLADSVFSVDEALRAAHVLESSAAERHAGVAITRAFPELQSLMHSLSHADRHHAEKIHAFATVRGLALPGG